MRPRSKPSLAASVSVCLLVAASCSSPAYATTTTVPSAGATAPAAQSLVSLSDFPAGWTAQGRVSEDYGASGLSKAQDANLVKCLKVPASDIDTNISHFTSPSFSDTSNAATVEDDLTVYPDAARARADYSTFSNPKTPQCLITLLAGPLRKEISKQLQQGETVGQVTSQRRPIPVYGRSSGDIELVVPIIEGAKEVFVYVDVIVVLEGRCESTLTASSPGTPVAQTLVSRLEAAAAARMRPISGPRG